ncbi:MAG: Rrf2 family transcriptional regulator [candidate division Zixibacteria bacterium]|nr:Rrf2 family transcriptional regulator [candidate division Zixibacteria bacterium]
MIYPQATAYAIEALAFMSGLDKGKAVKSRQLSKILDIPEQYLGKVMTQLVKKKYINSTKGPTSGFVLAVDHTKITFYRIMAALDSLTPLEEECVMGMRQCSAETPCAFHERWVKFKEQAISEAQNLTLDKFAGILLTKMRFQAKLRDMTLGNLLEN